MCSRRGVVLVLPALTTTLGVAGCGGGGGNGPPADVLLVAAVLRAVGQITQVARTDTDADGVPDPME